MYQGIIFVLLLTIVSSRGHENHEKKKEQTKYVEKDFYKLANRVISLERQYENYCRNDMDKRFKEIYGADSYTLKYFMKSSVYDQTTYDDIFAYKPEDVTIRVMHRAFYVEAKRQDSTERSEFWALKMLPDNLDAEQAWWTLEDDELEVTFPYKVPLGEEVNKSCGNIKYRVITVPMKKQEEFTNNETISDGP